MRCERRRAAAVAVGLRSGRRSLSLVVDGVAHMDQLAIFLFVGLSFIAEIAALVQFDRVLRIQSRSYPKAWKLDGQPVGVLTFWEEAVNCHPHRPDYEALLSSLALFFRWSLVTPAWACADAEARRRLWTVRGLVCICMISILCFSLLQTNSLL